MAGENEEDNGETTQRLQSSFGTSSSSLHHTLPLNQLNIPQLHMPQFRGQIRQQQSPISCGERENGGKRLGIPPSHPQIPPISPYSQIPFNRAGNQQNFSTSPRPSHSRSLSQPAFFAVDSLPPLVPSPYQECPSNSVSDRISTDVAMEEMEGGGRGGSHCMLPPSPFARGSVCRAGESLPPRKAHRRSCSDIPFGFSSILQSSPPRMPLRSPGALDRSEAQPVQLVKRESSWEKIEESGEGTRERKYEDDLFSAYMNLDNIDAFNSSETDDKLGNENRDDLDSRASGTKTNGGNSSDNEATSSVNESGSSAQKSRVSTLTERREGTKRNAGEDIAPTTRHYRSISMDSFMGNMSFDESPKMPPSPGTNQLSPANSLDANTNAFSLEFGNGEFSGVELKKIMTNEKLAEIASSDPKRAKRILANRQSAARSKERKMKYIVELEHKVQTLQTEATTLSAQLTMLHRDSTGLSSQNNELKFRLQSMEQQAQLRDALNEALTAEVQRLKFATTELSGNPSKFQQYPQMFQLRHQQATQTNMHQLQQQQQQQSQQVNGNNNKNTTKDETKQ
ncbi:hypothetical protein SASPL_124618 [Salvia splendens]|uniref:BZIP domain-containing protein n=1 Tax=Salvia splendens TaxID=180675 RepID=A0A8X8ZNI6_SALSN|nr:bZIP transcription factor 29-like [Salvia splendens]XP_041997736.1 bZIP transcription factor 29-like [Salvia splendens]XP_041997737.1 bZIP transcription factor 29-like [Salvia splendens]KAG6411962.1 hypothetical protein SASPL_124618 [Salvia splendens]